MVIIMFIESDALIQSFDTFSWQADAAQQFYIGEAIVREIRDEGGDRAMQELRRRAGVRRVEMKQRACQATVNKTEAVKKSLFKS